LNSKLFKDKTYNILYITANKTTMSSGKSKSSPKVKAIKAKDFNKKDIEHWELNVEDSEFNKFNYRSTLVSKKTRRPFEVQFDKCASRYSGLVNEDYVENPSDRNRLTRELPDDVPQCVEFANVLRQVDEYVEENLRDLLRPLAQKEAEKKAAKAAKKGKGKAVDVTDDDVEKMIDTIIEESKWARCLKPQEDGPSKCNFKFQIVKDTKDVIKTPIVMVDKNGSKTHLNGLRLEDLKDHLTNNISYKMVIRISKFWVMKSSDSRRHGVKLEIVRMEAEKSEYVAGGGEPADFCSSDDDAPDEEAGPAGAAEATTADKVDSKDKGKKAVNEDTDESSSDEKEDLRKPDDDDDTSES